MWLRIGAALHSLDDSWEHRRRGLWDAWAKRTTAGNFDPDDQEKTWEGFERDREDGVTWRTIRFVAIEHGWRPPRADDSAASSAPEPESFVRGDTGGILKTDPQNVRRAIRLLGVSLRHNEFSTQTEVAGLAGFGPELSNEGAIRLRFLVHETFNFLPARDLVELVLTDIAHQNRFHSVREWLAGLQWDRVPRIDNWLIAYAGAEDTPFNRAVGRIFLLAGVRRVRRPGCKFDTMLVLESRQGKDKSRALRALATKDEWFTDNVSLGADSKEYIEPKNREMVSLQVKTSRDFLATDMGEAEAVASLRIA